MWHRPSCVVRASALTCARVCVQYMTRSHVYVKIKCQDKNDTFHVYYPCSIVCCSYVFVCNQCIRIQPVYYCVCIYSYVTCMHLNVLVCYSYTLVCYSKVLVCYSKVLVCYSYVLVCTRMYSYVTRMYMLLACPSHDRSYVIFLLCRIKIQLR